MTENNSLLSGITRIAWGFVFILFHFTVNEIDLLPDFAGYISVALGIVCLGDALVHLKLLKPLSVVISVWTALLWLSKAFALTSFISAGYIDAVMGYLSTAMDIAILIFVIVLLTDLSALAAKHQQNDKNIDKKLLVARNIYAVCYSLSIGISLSALITNNTYPDFLTGILTALSIASSVAMLAAMIIILVALFSLRKALKDKATETYSLPPFGTDCTPENEENI